MIEKVREVLDPPVSRVWIAEAVADDAETVFLGCFASEMAAWRAGQRARAYDDEMFEVRVFEARVFSDQDIYVPAVFLD